MKIKIQAISDDAKFELRKSFGCLRVSVSFSGPTLSGNAPLILFGSMQASNVPGILAMLPDTILEDVGMEFESISGFKEIAASQDAITLSPDGRDVDVVGRFTIHISGEYATIRCRDLQIIVSIEKELPETAWEMAPDTRVSFTGHNFSLYWRPK